MIKSGAGRPATASRKTERVIRRRAIRASVLSTGMAIHQIANRHGVGIDAQRLSNGFAEQACVARISVLLELRATTPRGLTLAEFAIVRLAENALVEFLLRSLLHDHRPEHFPLGVACQPDERGAAFNARRQGSAVRSKTSKTMVSMVLAVLGQTAARVPRAILLGERNPLLRVKARIDTLKLVLK